MRFVRGNLLEHPAEALVNTVNTVGVGGKGVALQFKRAYPENFKAYAKACKQGEVKLGEIYVYQTGSLDGPAYILNFPTKQHWRSRSRLVDIESGLQDLVRVIRRYHITSVAIPPLGCGQGGLAWSDVRPRIESELSELSDVDITVFVPGPPPAPSHMINRTERPRLTRGRAAVILLLDRYLRPGYVANMLEVQKLAYFLQGAGEPLRLNFEPKKYGPYAETLHHVLQRMEGHFIVGYGDRASAASIAVAGDAVDEARALVSELPDLRGRLSLVTAVIDGFESPYGLELLASVHWIASFGNPSTVEDVIKGVQDWSARKAGLFSEAHVVTALQHLSDVGVLPESVPVPSTT